MKPRRRPDPQARKLPIFKARMGQGLRVRSLYRLEIFLRGEWFWTRTWQ